MKSDVCIIGAGPAGLFASIFSARSGAETVVVERNTTACRKLLRTGRSRCNLTHTGSVEDFVRAYGPFGRFLRHSLYEFSADDLREYFARQGLQTKVEKDGCVFPTTDCAGDVARVLVNDALRSSVRFLYGRRVQSIIRDQEDLVVFANKEKIQAKKVIVSTGGVSWPFTGSTGDGYEFAKAFGHMVAAPKAALVPLVTTQTWIGQLKGVGIKHVVIKTKVRDQRFCTSGSLMFTGDGIGGPAALDFSRFVTDFLPNYANPIEVTVDMMPQYRLEQLDKEIGLVCSQHPKKELAGVFTRFLPKSLILECCRQIGLSMTILAGRLTKSQRMQLARTLKGLTLSIVETYPVAEATVTRGGICTAEIDSKTMESRLSPHLFFAGEIVDVDGPCGGFNLQIAFSTGHLAGKVAAAG